MGLQFCSDQSSRIQSEYSALNQHAKNGPYSPHIFSRTSNAFAAQACAVNKDMGWDPDIVNVNGGAIAIGHPIGASGARILNTLLFEMQRRDAKKGLATLCIGGGMGVAMCLERP